MASNKDLVKKQTLYIGVGVAFIVGFLGGIVFSSVQSDNYGGPQQRQASAPGQQAGQAPGLNPQQAGQILALEQRVAANPSDADSWVKLGNIYFDSSKFDKAIRAYEKSLEIRPGNANVLTDLGVMYRRSGNPTMAINAFDRAIVGNPKHEQARFNKGIVLQYDMANVAEAIKTWEGLLAVNPGAAASNGVPVTQLIDEAKKQLK